MSRQAWLGLAAVVAGVALIATGLLLGWAWWFGQGMPHAAGAKGMSLREALLIFLPIVVGVAVAAIGVRLVRARL